MLTIPNVAPSYYNATEKFDGLAMLVMFAACVVVTIYDEWCRRKTFKNRESRRAMKRLNRETARMIRATDSMIERM